MAKRQMTYRSALLILAVAMVSALGGYGVALLGGNQEQRVTALIEQHLAANPEIVQRAIQELRRREAKAKQDLARSNLAAFRAELTRDPRAPVGGNPDGDVTVVEFFDYNCPYCRAVKPALRDLLAGDAGLRFVYKEFPILGEASRTAARAALAAARQGTEAYERFHDALLGVQGQLANDGVFRMAERIGLDMARLRADMEDPEIEAAIQANLKLASRLKITGTPAFVVGQAIIPGAVSLEELREAVSQARTKGTGS
jgi:protein-disulfide isomerase